MQVVIEIPEEDYIRLRDEGMFGNVTTFKRAVRDGISLPKGHGRLIDADRLRSMYSINRANFNTVVGIQKWIDDAPTIIEADRSESEVHE